MPNHTTILETHDITKKELMQKTSHFACTKPFGLILGLLILVWAGTAGVQAGPDRDNGALNAFFEDFNGVTPPDLPDGWSKAELTSMGGVHTLSNHNPYSPPNHLRMETNYDANATLFLMTPVVTDFSSNWLRFYAKTGSTLHDFDVEVGYLNDPDNHHSFELVETITVSSNEYELVTLFFDEDLGDDDQKKIAFRFAPEAIVRQLFLDNITWEATESDEEIVVSPEAQDFGPQQTGITSPEKLFAITNDGLSEVTIAPDDILLSGEDADAFELYNIPEPVELAYGESIDVGVAFSPDVEGDYAAALEVKDLTVPLGGEGVDFTITSYPYFQDYHQVSTPNLPVGWGSIVDHPGLDEAAVETTSAVGPHSPPNHVRIISNDNQQAEVLLVSPPFDDLENKRVRFWAKCNSATNIPDLVVGTMSDPHDAETFTAHYTVEAYSDLSDEYEQFVFSFEGEIPGHHYVAFRHGGTPNFTRSIFVDDFMIEEIPQEPLLVIEPASFDFGEYQVNTQSLPYGFVLRNEGVGELVLESDDFAMTGAHADDFLLDALSEPIALDPFETHTIHIAFAPQDTGHREATLDIDGTELELQGEGIDASIVDVPFTEDFNEASLPDLPQGWTSIVHNPDYDQAAVFTTVDGDPHSPPIHAALVSNDYEEAEVLLISPPVASLNQREITFYAKGNQSTYLPDLIVGTMSDPSDISTFTPMQVISGEEDLGETYTAFTVPFTDAGLDEHIAFKHGTTPSYIRTIYIDEVVFEELLVETALVITPDAHDFEVVEVGESSGEQEFTILNDGGGTLVIGPGNITLDGHDAGDFILQNLAEEVHLLGGESATIAVTFAPQGTGDKQATLVVKDEEVPLTGHGIDTSVSTFPWTVGFSGIEEGDIPQGWHAGEDNWGVSVSDQAGGTPPEMNFSWSPAFEGTSTLTSPLILTDGFEEMWLSFRHKVSNFGDPGSYTLKVLAIADGIEHLVAEWVDPDDIPAEQVSVNLNASDHEVGSDNFRLAWVFEGNTTDIYDWFIDDIYLGEEPAGHAVTFRVDMSDAADFDPDLHQVFIAGSFGGDMDWNTPGENPDLVLSPIEGSMTYALTIELEAGEYAYKYASDAYGEGWDGAEWAGDPNREVVVDGDMETNDIWGVPEDEVSVAVPEKDYFAVYPNPASGYVHLESASSIEKVELLDVAGQILVSEYLQADTFTLGLEGLQPGIYFLRAHTGSGRVETQRLHVLR